MKQFGTVVGAESTSKEFAECLKSDGILKATTMPYTPQSNGVVELANRRIMEHV